MRNWVSAIRPMSISCRVRSDSSGGPRCSGCCCCFCWGLPVWRAESIFNQEIKYEQRCCRSERSPFRRSAPSAVPWPTSNQRTGRHRDEGSGRALRRRPQGDQLRDRRQHHPHRVAATPTWRAWPRSRPACRWNRWPWRSTACAPRACRASSRPRRTSCSAMRLRHRRRRRSHVRGAYLLPAMRTGARMGDTKLIDIDGRHADRPVRRRPHGHHRREPGRQVGHHARGAGRAGGRIAPPRRRRDRRRAASSRRSCRSSSRPARAKSSSTPTSM